MRLSSLAGRRHRSASVRINQKKPTFKIVKEVVTQEKKKFRTVASYNAEPPHGYSFIPVGYPDLTELCKKKCQDQNLQFQTVNATPKNKANLDPDKVSHHIHRVGNHFPTDIVQRSCHQLGYWSNPLKPGEYKKYNVGLENQLSRHRHKDERDKIRSAIQELFPNLPAKDLKEILHHAFRKGSMRVGNADMPLIRRVQLAVSAHARHNYTDYDQLLKKISWGEARQAAEQPTLNQLKKWRGEDFDNHETEQVLRETIILDSESDTDSDVESSDESDDTAARNGERDVSLEFVSHNTFGDDRAAGVGRTRSAGPADAYVAASRRQAEYQALSALHSRQPSGQRSWQQAYSALPPQPPAPNNYRNEGDLRLGQRSHYASSRPQTRTQVDPRSAQLLHDRPRPAEERYSAYQPSSNGGHYPPLIQSSGPSTYGISYNPSMNEDAAGRVGRSGPPTHHLASSHPGVYLQEGFHHRHDASHHAAYDPEFPRLPQERTPDRVVRSVETDPPHRQYDYGLKSPHLGPRLITDHNGQTVIIPAPAEPSSIARPPYRQAADHVARLAWSGGYPAGETWPDSKRRRVSPPIVHRLSPRQPAYVDLTQDSFPRRIVHPSDPRERFQHDISRPVEHGNLERPRKYQLVPISGPNSGQLSHAPVWLDGASDRPNIAPAPRYAYNAGPPPREDVDVRGRHEPAHNYSTRQQARPAQSAHNERREPQALVPQAHRPDDAMRSLYDERDPQQPRKPQKKPHTNRPRYHDHDPSAVRQTEQALDYT